MTIREKLIELMCKAVDHGREGCDSQETCDECPYRKFHPRCLEAVWADHLIANGVTIQDREIDFDYEAEVE